MQTKEWKLDKELSKRSIHLINLYVSNKKIVCGLKFLIGSFI